MESKHKDEAVVHQGAKADDSAKKAEHPEHPQEGPIVDITIDSKPYKIHRGHQTVADIKTLGGIPQAFELEQVIDGKLTPLQDGGSVTIKGGEKFVSYPKDNTAS